jgi:hypothetical protein
MICPARGDGKFFPLESKGRTDEPIPIMTMDGLVLPLGPAGRCDDFRVGGAVVDHDALSGIWRMWYYCRDKSFYGPPTLGSGRVALATSADGVYWQRIDGPEALGAVFAPSPETMDFDSLHVGLTDVSRGAGEWLMWYFGGNREPRTCTNPAIGTQPGLGMRPGLARSSDGVHWTRMRGQASGGALLDFSEVQLYVSWPNAHWDGRRWLMQYTAPTRDLGQFETHIAASPDALHWTTLGPLRWADGSRPYDEAGMVTRQVLANPLPSGRRWLMVYTAVNAAHARTVAAAESDDGLTWHHLYDQPIFRVGPPGAWDDFGVAANRLVAVGGQLYFYYYGFQTLGSDGLRGIGLATAPLGDLRELTRHTQ